MFNFGGVEGDFNLFSVSTDDKHGVGVGVEKSEDLKTKILSFRNEFYNSFLLRYFELLPHVIKYKGTDHDKIKSIDWLKLEVALRNNFECIVGENNEGDLVFLGYTANRFSITDPQSLFNSKPLTYDDITFIIPKENRPKKDKDFTEITRLDNCKSGKFVVIRNKALNFVNDNRVIKHYAESLAEIVTSRYSLTLQAKVLTFFKSEKNDETMNQIVSDLYNGAPYVKTSKLFEPEDNIFTLNNAVLASNLTEMKREYQNQLNELNSFIGVDSLGVDKTSGVSDIEAKSGNPFSKNIANMYLDARNNPLKCLNKHYEKEGIHIEAIFDNNVQAELMNSLPDSNKENDNE